jgi:DNA-binding sugar fermentation-stimulating protein
MSSSATSRIIFRYETRLLQGAILKKRYKRFLADVQLPPGYTDPTGTEDDKETIENGTGCSDTVVYVPNTGSMLNLVPPQLIDPLCVLSVAPPGSKRKYRHTVEMIQVGGSESYVGIHSALANKMVANALKLDLIPECSGFTHMQQEVKVEHQEDSENICDSSEMLSKSKKKSNKKQSGSVKKKADSRIDFELLFGNPPNANELPQTTAGRKRKQPCSEHELAKQFDISQRMLIEVKSVTLAPYEDIPPPESFNRLAEFPDSVSIRALKHAECLMHHVLAGGRAAILFLIQRDDCSSFTISTIDAAYKEAVREAQAAGVLILPYVCRMNPIDRSVELLGRVPFLE